MTVFVPSPLVRFLLGLALAIVSTLATSVARADPPARIARLSYFIGTASFSPAGDDQWAHAVLNRPVFTGDRLWSDDGARIELSLDGGALRLGSRTSIVVSNIDDRVTQFELQQGVVDLRVRRMSAGDVVEIDTPNLALQVTQPGRYRVDVDPQSGTTTVVVRDGAAEVYGSRASYSIGRGQAYRFYGADLTDSEYFTPRGEDDFDRFAAQRDSRFDRLVSTRYVSPEVVGYEDLDRYGGWQPDPSYGNVWFPRDVPDDWAPYRHGHWSWIEPWGWTWVDDAPWGFAPFHYGRWAYVQNRWGWVPGPVNARPVYAPALVAFVGSSNFSVSASSGPAIGWFPLAPREVYRPAYNVSRDYYRRVNVSNTVINNTIINNTYVSNVTVTTAPPAPQGTYRNLRAPNAVTAVPRAALAQSQPVQRFAVRMDNAALTNVQVQSLATIAPARAAFLGGTQAAQARPPASVRQQPIVARTMPPPAPVPVAERLPTLERNPGKPLERTEAPPNRGGGLSGAPPQNFKIADAPKPAAKQQPPAVQGDANRPRHAAPGMGAPPPAAATSVPPPTGAPASAPVAAPANPPAAASATPPAGMSGAQPPLPLPQAQPPSAGAGPVVPGQRSPQAPVTQHATPSAPSPTDSAERRKSIPERATQPAQPPVPPQQPRVLIQEPRPAPQAQPPAAAQPEQRRGAAERAIPQPPLQAAPQAQPSAVPQQPRVLTQPVPQPAPQTQPQPQAQPQAAPQQPRVLTQPAPQAQPPAPPRPTPQAQPQPQPQAAPPSPPKQDRPHDEKKDKDKDKDKEKDKNKP